MSTAGVRLYRVSRVSWATAPESERACTGDALTYSRRRRSACSPRTFADEELKNLREGKDGFAAGRCATGLIRYTRSTTGVTEGPTHVTGRLVYAPTVMTADLPWDIHAFKQEDEAFPHHSTLDQLFTDQKFEAYRVLGRSPRQAQSRP